MRRERDTIFLCWLFVHRQLSTHWPNQRMCVPCSPQTGPALPKSEKSTRFVYVQISTHCFFFKITKNPSPSLLGMTSFTSPVTFLIWGFYYDILDYHILPEHAGTPALMSSPTHALSRKVLSLTKPKDKIYKTKNDNIKKILPQLYNR